MTLTPKLLILCVTGLWACLAGTLFLAGTSQAAGLDCTMARLPDEQAVCGDKRLSTFDDLLNKRFQDAKPSAADPEELKHRLRNFLADRHDCGRDTSCILATYIAALWAISDDRDTDLKDVSATMMVKGKPIVSSKIPSVIGDCSATTVLDVHPRLDMEDPDFSAGIGIDYANEGYGVSYSREEPVARSKPGDPVVLCLIEIDRDCPPDSGGRLFLTTNQRTGESWILPDTQHTCGG